MRTSPFRFGLVAFFLAPFALSSSVMAAPNANHAKADADHHDPDNVRGISRFMEMVVDGNGKFVAHDFNGAIDVYRKAIQLAPKNPLGYYVLAEAELATGNVTEAQASAEQGESSSDDRNPNLRGKILFLEAAIKERWSIADHPNKWADAKTAWETYAEYASKHADAGLAPASATARIAAIDAMVKQDKAYDVVRERITVEKSAAASAATKK